MSLVTPPLTNPAIVPEFTIGDRLRKAREHSGYEIRQLAEQIGVHRHSLAAYEQGDSKVRRSVILSVSLITGVDPVWLETGVASCTPGDSNSEPTVLRSKTKRKRRVAEIVVADLQKMEVFS